MAVWQSVRALIKVVHGKTHLCHAREKVAKLIDLLCLAGPVTALALWQGGALIAAAHADQTLIIHRASLAKGGLQYAPVAKVDLPNSPTDVAALHFPVPTLAVGCEGR